MNNENLLKDVQQYIQLMEEMNQQLQEKNEQLQRENDKLRTENQLLCLKSENLVLELDIINKALIEQRKRFMCRVLEERAERRT